jgi:hypothetical protein
MMIRRMTLHGLTLAGAMLVSAVAVKYGQRVQLIDAETAARAIGVVTGLVLAIYANFMPKDVPESRGPTPQGGRAQAATRVGGWAFALAGLGYAAANALAPEPVVFPASLTLVAAAVAITALYAIAACLPRPTR